MKKLIYFSIIAFLFLGTNMFASNKSPEEYLGLPGDNFNLYAVMNLFQESETLESFERKLNDPEIMINNLDLNGDNYVDYVMVFDYPDDDVHNVVLRVALNEKEYQDVAVFNVYKFNDGSVQIQLIGDEYLYGKDYIIEPNYDGTPNPGYTGASNSKKSRYDRDITIVTTNYYEVASWPVIVYISRPSYRPWHSSWYWNYYPSYWHPWTPYYWDYYYGYHYNCYNHYYTYYRPWHHIRNDHFHTVYYSNIRHSSPTVVVNINKGHYKRTYDHPEKRKEGESLYAQRISSGSTIPGSDRGKVSRNSSERLGQSGKANESERAARANTNEKDRAVRTNSSESNNTARPNTNVTQQRQERPSKSDVKVSISKRIEERPKSDRQENKNSREIAPSDKKERSVSPVKSNERSKPNQESVASSKTESQRSSNTVRNASNERSQPAQSQSHRESSAKTSEVKKQTTTRDESKSAKEISSNTKESEISNSKKR